MLYQSMTKKLLTVVGIILLVVFAVHTKGFRTIGLTKVDSYNTEHGCLVVSAACGECYGKVIGNDCYIDKNKLSPQELKVMGFN